MEFICYSKCTTCKKAQKYLDNHSIKYEERDIKTKNPTKKELMYWITKYDLNVDKLFNTSGLLYRSMNLKDKLSKMDLEEKVKLLASDGMLVKRPLLVNEDNCLIGFKEKEWDEYFK